MHWTDRWIGLPYQEMGRGPESYDCLGLFIALQEARFGRLLDYPACKMGDAARSKLADQARPKWRVVHEAQEGSAILWKVRGFALHVGFALDARRMLHVNADVGESVIEDFNAMGWGQRLEGIYEYCG